MWEKVLASPAYVKWQEEYEPALERWFDLMVFEEEWETEECLDVDSVLMARAYLQEALTIIEKHSLYRAAIDWPALGLATWQRAVRAQQPLDTYPAIEFAIQQLNDGHSFFWPPAKVQAIHTGAEDNRNRLPTGRLIASDIAYLHVPNFMGSAEATTAYARVLQQIIAELEASGPIGWIVDLTDNGGGNLWPMLVGLGPLFDTEKIGAFVDGDSKQNVWRYVAGQFMVGEGVCLAIEPPVIQLQHRPAPVAVLIGPETCSSGEMVAIAFRGQAFARSFGQPTKGLTTANADFVLSDGAKLYLTIAVSADRTGQPYSGALLPDIVVEGTQETLQAVASEWLRRVAASRPLPDTHHLSSSLLSLDSTAPSCSDH